MTALGQGRVRSPGADRHRMAILVRIAASSADFSPKLANAVDRATDFEVKVMADLLERGMTIPALVSFLQGAHIIVGDESLYESWIFPISRKRMSSHHRTVDKEATPDYGLDGPLVRESLHGKAPIGTWIQLERTKATFQPGKLPTWTDVIHIRDFLIYRITGKNVGPWGLSAHVDTRPMVLQPQHIRTGEGAGRALAGIQRRRDRASAAAEAARWSDLLTPDIPAVGPFGDAFLPPDPPSPRDLLPDAPYKEELGEGLFGSLNLVTSTAPLTPGVVTILDSMGADDQPLLPAEPTDAQAGPVTLRIRGHQVATRGYVRAATQPQVFIGMEEQS